MWSQGARLLRRPCGMRMAAWSTASPSVPWARRMTPRTSPRTCFLSLFRKLGGLRDPGALRSFIISVTIRKVKSKLRGRRLRRWVGLTEGGQLPDPSQPWH